MKVNKNKRHFIVSNNERVSIKIDDVQVESNKNHLDGIIKEASPEVNICLLLHLIRIKEVLYFRWNEHHSRAYFETLMIRLLFPKCG